MKEERDYEGGVLIVPVVGEFGGGEGGVAFEEALVHMVDIHGFRDCGLYIYNDGICLLGVIGREIVDAFYMHKLTIIYATYIFYDPGGQNNR